MRTGRRVTKRRESPGDLDNGIYRALLHPDVCLAIGRGCRRGEDRPSRLPGAASHRSRRARRKHSFGAGANRGSLAGRASVRSSRNDGGRSGHLRMPSPAWNFTSAGNGILRRSYRTFRHASICCWSGRGVSPYHFGQVGSPLLRYRTGDLVRPVGSKTAPVCAEVLSWSLEGGILGRADDMIVIKGVTIPRRWKRSFEAQRRWRSIG